MSCCQRGSVTIASTAVQSSYFCRIKIFFAMKLAFTPRNSNIAMRHGVYVHVTCLVCSEVVQLEEMIDQFIPSDPTWKGWVKMAFQQPLIPVIPVARELFSKTKWGANAAKVAGNSKKRRTGANDPAGSTTSVESSASSPKRTRPRFKPLIGKRNQSYEVQQDTDISNTTQSHSPTTHQHSHSRTRVMRFLRGDAIASDSSAIEVCVPAHLRNLITKTY